MRTEISTLAESFSDPTRRIAGGVEAVYNRSLVSFDNGEVGGEATKMKRVYVCPVAGKP